MGVGETVSRDERGRITIPSEIRKTIGKKDFTIQLVEKYTTLLIALNQDDILEQVKSIKLIGDHARATTDFSTVKDGYGAREIEVT